MKYFHFLPEGISGKSQRGCSVGLSKGLTLFQSNTYKVNLRAYPTGIFYVEKGNTINH